MLEYDSESDITANGTEEEIPKEIHIIFVKSTHDEVDSSEDKSVTEFETLQVNEEEIVVQENKQVLPVFNKTIHDEDDSSEDANEIAIEPNVCITPKDDEDDSIENQPTNEIEPSTKNGEQDVGKQNKLCTTNFQVEIENRIVEGLITYSFEHQIFEIKANSGNNQEFWGVNADFTSYELEWTIDAILQHMGFYPTTENPCVMMREDHKTKSCECIIVHQDESYFASTTLEEILDIFQNKYKIKINPDVYLGSYSPYDPGGTMIC